MTRKYTKAEAIGIVVRCAQTYKQELDGKNLLFICTDKHKKTIPIELSFYGNNYLHLTGLKAPKSENGDIAGVCEGTNKTNDRQFYLNRRTLLGNMHGQAPVLWCVNAFLER